MTPPVQITFRHIPASAAIESKIHDKVARLGSVYDRITSCRVVIEAPHRRHHHGKLYHVHINLVVPDAELVVSHEPHDQHAHEDVYVAIRDAFHAARRQLEDYARRRRGEMKKHEAKAS